MRTDLNMRKGKMVAQGAHASLGTVLKMQMQSIMDRTCMTHWWDPMHDWLEGTFTKICVQVGSEAELLEIYHKAVDTEPQLPAKLIRDSGLTEFHGVPTLTCCAIGPYWADEIDKVTGHLKLL